MAHSAIFDSSVELPDKQLALRIAQGPDLLLQAARACLGLLYPARVLAFGGEEPLLGEPPAAGGKQEDQEQQGQRPPAAVAPSRPAARRRQAAPVQADQACAGAGC